MKNKNPPNDNRMDKNKENTQNAHIKLKSPAK